MLIETLQTTTYKLTNLDCLDPVTVYTENHEPGKGKITIECYGKSWSSYWGGMGGRTVEAFFCSRDEHYLAKKLSSVESSVPDFEALSEKIGVNVEEGAAVMWDREVVEAIREHYGCEPWEADLPTKANPDYAYLCRIVKTVQQGLREASEAAA